MKIFKMPMLRSVEELFQRLVFFASHFGNNTVITIFSQGFLAGIAGLAIYFAAAVALDIKEAKSALGVVRRRFLR